MDDFLKSVTSDFAYIAAKIGFRFNQYSGSVDWENLEELVFEEMYEKTDVKSLSALVASVLSYNVEKISPTKKIFRLSQLIIDFLLHYKKHSIFKYNDKKDSEVLCELCGKEFVDVNFLKHHCFHQDTLDSCTVIDSPKDKLIENLKLEVVKLQNKLRENNSTFHNKIQGFRTCVEKCDTVHKNKLSYHLVPQPGDNPMQIQEMYWKQKYDSLEESFNNLKNEYERNQNTTKAITVSHHKYQQCDFYKTEKSSKYVQTEFLNENVNSVCSPKKPPQKSDISHCNENKGVHDTDILNNDQMYTDGCRWNGDGSSDKDFYELKKLRLEARINCIENNLSEEYSEPLLYPEYVDSIKIVLILGENQVNELFKNTPLMDLIKLDVKELVNKRLEECYKFTDKNSEQDYISYKKDLSDNQETHEISINENNTTAHVTSRIDRDKTSIKKNETVMSRLKKKALRLGKVFSSDSKDKRKESSTKNLGLSHLNDTIELEKNEDKAEQTPTCNT